MSNPFLAVPGQTVVVEGVCSKTGAALNFIGRGSWLSDGTCRWYCREIYLASEFDQRVSNGWQQLHDPQLETMPAIVVSQHVTCPCCGALPWGFTCGPCKTINCGFSLKNRRRGPFWSRKETLSTCGRCGNQGVITGSAPSTIQGVRDRGPAAPETTSTAIELRKGW